MKHGLIFVALFLMYVASIAFALWYGASEGARCERLGGAVVVYGCNHDR